MSIILWVRSGEVGNLVLTSYTELVRKRVFVFLITILGIYLGFNLVRGAWESYQNAGRLLEAENRLKKAQEENQRLKDDLVFKSSPYFVEKEARDKLGLAKKGETVVITPAPDRKEEEQKSPYKDLTIQEQWWKVFFN